LGEPFASLAAREPRSRSDLHHRRRRTETMLAAAALAVSLVLMPPLYALVAFHGGIAPLDAPKIQIHLALNCAANFCVMLGALRARGRLDQRLAELFWLTVLAHGALAFAILVTRTYYSIPMMIVGAMASFVWGVAIIMLRGRLVRPRIGIVGPWHPIFEDANLDCLTLEGPEADLSDIDQVLVTWGEDQSLAPEPLIIRALLAGKRVRHVADFMEEARGACELDHFSLDQISPHPLESYRRLKRALDVAFGLLVLPLVVPIFAVAAILIVFTMGWPVFFVQRRVGLSGRTFRMFKLRTMRSATGPVETAATGRDDPRVTPVGRVLRRFRIDELPQLFNVLVGDMSIIGPRPEQPALTTRYAVEAPEFAVRLLVRPGITGWAQVRAGYAADLAESKVKLSYDLFYIKNFSFGLDLRILAWTIWTLAHGGGVR
jgi:lipopolysaccharide/colanic/teichoic acid biosynthesis glycosyltransferase